jgi:hypothetical protein
MCPFCFASIGLIVAGTASTGGLAVLALKLARKKNAAGEIVSNSNQRRNQNVDKQDREPENSFAR